MCHLNCNSIFSVKFRIGSETSDKSEKSEIGEKSEKSEISERSECESRHIEATQLDASRVFFVPGCDDGQHLSPDLPGVKSVRFVDACRCWYLHDEIPGMETSYKKITV